MAEFDCRVADNAGRVFSQVEAAHSEAEVRQKLSDRGLLVYSVNRRGGLAAQAMGRDRVREGSTLSEALDKQGMFPKVYVTAVLAGEKSGNLTGVLDYFIEYQRVSLGAKKKLLSALVYPAI